MLFKKIIVAASAVALTASPALAAASTADVVRAAPKTERANSLYGGSSGEIAVPIVLGALFLLIVGHMIFDEDEELPVSP